MSDENFKYTYFTLRGRGEVARLLFAAAKQNFEHVPVDLNTEWASLKPNTKHKVLPELQVNGVTYSQSLAINSFLAKEFGFLGSSNLEALAIEEIQNLREDLLIAEARCHFEKDPAAKEEREKAMAEVYPRYLGFFNDAIEKNGTGFAVGSKLSLADITIFEGFTSLSQLKADLIEKYPHVAALRKKVAETDGIKEYLQSAKPSPL